MHYCSDIELAFSSVVHITRDVYYEFVLRYLHANGASIFFQCVYFHIGWGLRWLYKSDSLKCGSYFIFLNDTDGFYRLCNALRANVFLSRYSNNQFIIGYSLLGGDIVRWV